VNDLTALRHQQSRFIKRSDEGQAVPQRQLLKPSDLSPFERELLELIIVAPEIAPVALERVQLGWLQCAAAKQMLDSYQQLEFDGQSLEFNSVLNALEDPSLKSLLVTLHEQANAKLRFTRESAENRLRVLTQRMGEQQDVLRRQQQISTLEKKELSPKDELDMLQDVIRQARLRQGLELKQVAEPNPPPADTSDELESSLSEDITLPEQSSPT
jgi:hypothetical protein